MVVNAARPAQRLLIGFLIEICFEQEDEQDKRRPFARARHRVLMSERKKKLPILFCCQFYLP